MAILLLSVLNMVPGPPGLGGTVAISIIGATIAMLLGPASAPDWRLGGSLSFARQARWTIGWAVAVARLVDRPRLETAPGIPDGATNGASHQHLHPSGKPAYAASHSVYHAVPNTGIAIICASRINRDGLGVFIGGMVAALGLAIACAAIWAASCLRVRWADDHLNRQAPCPYHMAPIDRLDRRLAAWPPFFLCPGPDTVPDRPPLHHTGYPVWLHLCRGLRHRRVY